MNKEKLSNAVLWVSIAFVMKYLDINLFGLNILPDWLGFVILLYHMETLTEVRPDIGLLEPLGKLLLLWEIIEGVCAMFGAEFSLYGIGLIFSVVWMYLQFQLLTDLAEIAKDSQYANWNRMLQLRTALTLVATVAALPLDWNGGNVYSFALGAVFLVSAFWLFRVLFAFSDFLHPHETLPFSDSLKGE